MNKNAVGIGLAAMAVMLPAPAADLNPPQLDPKAGEGCWVRFFADANFRHPLGRVAGALYINSTAGPGFIGDMKLPKFVKSVHSVMVGPEATFIGYAQPGFSQEVFRLGPNDKVSDLRRLGFPANVASLKVACDR